MILFDSIVFGPLKSRRFGASLGINLLPLENKICNFDCIYCECGWTDLKGSKKYFFEKEKVVEKIGLALAEHSQKGTVIDSITFAGNGEPTMHPEFNSILEQTIRLRDLYYPAARVVVLSNSALLANKKVKEALLKADWRILKLDAGTEQTFQQINKPLSKITLQKVVAKLREFKDNLFIQTLFLSANENGKEINNSTSAEVGQWIKLLKEINPLHVMIYTVDRATPMKRVKKVGKKRMDEICQQVRKEGLSAEVYT